MGWLKRFKTQTAYAQQLQAEQTRANGRKETGRMTETKMC